ncbi:YdcF family protein [Taibaiella soli]|uniref:YdcF family protein n=1 Tax=Taibaiella soli TaxID=1649169 RepID=A0A2W2B901_9BACT|nr:YdcF family protein [Taibaiella soli]
MVITFTSLLPLLSCFSSKKSQREAYQKAQQIGPFDAVIVPGVPFKDGRWDTVMKARVLWSWVLYKNGVVKNIIYSGGAVYSPYIEAKIMGLYAQQLGIPRENIYYDSLAQHSTENVYYSYLLAKQLGFKTIALATDPFQSLMLRGYTKRRFATDIFHLPFSTDSISKFNYLNPVIDPQSAFVSPWESITKKKGFWARFRGTLGRDIDWAPYKNGRVDPL